jgi:RNA polymerase sigma factor CnrH
VDGGVSSDCGACSAVSSRAAHPRAAHPREWRAARKLPRIQRVLATSAATERLTDAELVTLSLNGVDRAFSRLLERHARHLRRLVTRRLRNPQDVLDVLQDTHLALWRALQRYDASRPFEAWLTSIALNKCRDWARRRVAQSSLLTRMQAEAAFTCAGAKERSAEHRVMEKESVRELGRALHRLPRQLREPLVLTTLRDLSQAAAARQLRLTRKAVEMRVRRARLRLVETLRGDLSRRKRRPANFANEL